MSEGRRICVCGKERGKGPVVITITTCKHNTPPIIEGATVCMAGMSPPLATSSPIDLQTDPKSGNEKKDTGSRSTKSTKEQSPDGKSISDGRSINTVKSSHPEGRTSDDTAYTTALDETALESSLDETAFESAVDETAFKTALDETVQDITADDTTESAAQNESQVPSDITDSKINETTNDTTEVTESQLNETNMSENTTGVTDDSVAGENETINESEYHTADESSEMTEDVDNKDDTGEPMVIMLAETAVNTLPFLDNLFWPPKYATKAKPSSSDDQEKCTMELLMFEKHTSNCRENWKNNVRDNLFFDGTAFIQSIGRMSYPTCPDDVQKKESGGSNAEKGYKSDSEKNLDRCKKIFQSFERHIQNEQLYNNDKSLTQFDIVQNKDTKDCAVQFERIDIRAPKWYDGFLICFGLKPNEDMYYLGDDINSLSHNSSSLVTKYLRI